MEQPICDTCGEIILEGYYKCLSCLPCQVCLPCVGGRKAFTWSCYNHPVQYTMVAGAAKKIYGDVQFNFKNRIRFTCPICGDIGFSDRKLFNHLCDCHLRYTIPAPVLCPICAVRPNPRKSTGVILDIISHFTNEHHIGMKDYEDDIFDVNTGGYERSSPWARGVTKRDRGEIPIGIQQKVKKATRGRPRKHIQGIRKSSKENIPTTTSIPRKMQQYPATTVDNIPFIFVLDNQSQTINAFGNANGYGGGFRTCQHYNGESDDEIDVGKTYSLDVDLVNNSSQPLSRNVHYENYLRNDNIFPYSTPRDAPFGQRISNETCFFIPGNEPFQPLVSQAWNQPSTYNIGPSQKYFYQDSTNRQQTRIASNSTNTSNKSKGILYLEPKLRKLAPAPPSTSSRIGVLKDSFYNSSVDPRMSATRPTFNALTNSVPPSKSIGTHEYMKPVTATATATSDIGKSYETDNTKK